MFNYFVREVLLPPVSLFFALGLVLYFYERKRVAARRIGFGLVFLGICLSTKVATEGLAHLCQRTPATTAAQVESFQGDCIVILGAGVNLLAPEFGGGAVPTPETLARLSYGCYLVQQTALPVIASGGYGETPEASEAATMARTLKMWGVPEVILEETSRNTRENAIFSANIARARGYKRIILVTSASHMPRALRSFEATGLDVLAAPTAFRAETVRDRGVTAWFPTFRYLENSCDYLQALVGEAWYLVKD